jgi:signal transduction histidine kinase/CheY-like chemotaxis protein
MNFSLFDEYPSAIVILSKESVIYRNNIFNSIVTNGTTLPSEILNFYENDLDKLVYIHNKVYYARKINIYNNILLEFQDIDIGNINLLITNLSKEIRSPLHGIAGIVDILSNSTLNAQQHEYMDVIRDCSTDLLHIINNMLDYVKISQKKIVLKCKIFDINEIIDETYQMLQLKLDEKKISINYNIDRFSQKYIGDPYRIQQILIHILTNAIEYTKNGIIELNVNKITSINNIDEIELEIKDTGIGIKKEELSNLFTPFYKTQNTLTNRIGLGLVITKHLVELMNGKIEIKSEFEKGTTVKFGLNIKRNEGISDIEFQNKMTNKSILIINGNNQERYDLSSFVLKNKMKVVSTPLIKEATTVYLENKYHFDFIIVNIIDADKESLVGLREKITTLAILKNTMMIEIDETNVNPLSLSRPIQFDKLKMLLYDNVKLIVSKKEKSILIVEDQISNQIVISKHLNLMGHKNIDIANNGEEGIIKVLNKQENYDLILMDFMMPVMNGIDATKNILKIDSSNVILGITADATRDISDCIKIGMLDVIIKPVTFKDFKNTCNKYLY